MRYVTAVALSGPSPRSGIARLRTLPPARPQFSINQSSAFVGSSVAAEDIVPWLSAGQGDGGSRYFWAELSRWSEKPQERLGVGPLVWLSEAPSQDKDYQDDDPDQGDTGLPRRLLDSRRGLQSSRRNADDRLSKYAPSSGARPVRASGPWRVSSPGAREMTALNNQRQTNWTVDKAVQPPTHFISGPFCPASQSSHPEPGLDGAAPAPAVTSDP